MKERPILFNSQMVQAILSGRKTQTRRVVKKQGITMFPMLEAGGIPRGDWFISSKQYERVGTSGHKCPFGQPGDRLWVRETWAHVHASAYRYSEGCIKKICPSDRDTVAVYAAELNTDWPGRWRPSIHMPRWASRITLEITGVRVERLQDISEDDARYEGISDGGCLNCGNSEPCGCDNPEPDARDAFILLWESINGTGSWDANPWVWVVEFRRVMP